MTIETLIGDLIAAVKENTAALVAAQSGAEVKSDAKPTTAKAAVETALKAAEEAKAKKEAEKAKEPPKEEAKTETKALDYAADVQPKLTAFLSKHGRDAFFSVLAPFGAKKGTELKADDYAAVLAAIDEFDLTA